MKKKFQELKFTKMSCLQNENDIEFKTGSPNNEDDSFGIRVTKCLGTGCKDQSTMENLI